MIARSALFLIIGFLLAGVVRAVMVPETIARVFGQGWFSQVYKSSLFGIPLPLCSCSVLPVAAQLHRSGLSRAGTVSFLISTPETGVDSIALSYKLLGPIFAAVRPVAALVTALLGGAAIRFLTPLRPADEMVPLKAAAGNPGSHGLSRLKEGLIYVARDMFPELAYYLFWGYLLAGLVAALIPNGFQTIDLSAVWQYLGMIIASLPVYVCATSSTPLAAVMLSLGVLPGAVLTFLLVGPATNLTSLVVQKRILGLKGMVIMTLSIVIAGVICGLLFDLLLEEKIAVKTIISSEEHELLKLHDILAGILLAFLMTYYTLRHYYKKMIRIIQRPARND